MILLRSPGVGKAAAVAVSKSFLFVLARFITVECMPRILRRPRYWKASISLYIAFVRWMVSKPYISLLRMIASITTNFHFLLALVAFQYADKEEKVLMRPKCLWF